MNMESKRKLVELEIKANNKALGLIEEVKEVILKFDGKVPNKRVDTALKKIDDCLSFKAEFNSFIIDMFIRDRSFDNGNNWVYIKNTVINICHCACQSMYGDSCLNEDGTINSEAVIIGLEKRKESLKSYNEEMIKSLNEIEDKIKEYEELKKTIRAFNDSVNYTVANYFEIDKIRNIY